MTINEFNALCTRYTIHPTIALENDMIVENLLSIRDTNCDNAKRGYINNIISILERDC